MIERWPAESPDYHNTGDALMIVMPARSDDGFTISRPSSRSTRCLEWTTAPITLHLAGDAFTHDRRMQQLVYASKKALYRHRPSSTNRCAIIYFMPGITALAARRATRHNKECRTLVGGLALKRAMCPARRHYECFHKILLYTLQNFADRAHATNAVYIADAFLGQ